MITLLIAAKPIVSIIFIFVLVYSAVDREHVLGLHGSKIRAGTENFNCLAIYFHLL